jgi:hypothetical protein
MERVKMAKTGYYARASEDGHRASQSKAHIVLEGNPVCGYKPHKTMQFCWCANGVVEEYVDCVKCRRWYARRVKEYYERVAKRAFRWSKEKKAPGRIRV